MDTQKTEVAEAEAAEHKNYDDVHINSTSATRTVAKFFFSFENRII